jgi:nitric oxide dioxygenase
MITEEQKQLIKATVPVLREHGVALTSHFYQRMFTHNPELKNIFNMGNQQKGKQQLSLALAVLAYAENIDNPAVLMPRVDSIGQKHTSLDIRPEHYILVGKHLIASISEVLGEAATPEILDAWTTAYNQLAAIMSGHESKLYNKQVEKPGGWTGWRPFIVKERTEESNEITSFYLYPADGGALADFIPGQYISVRTFIPELNLLQPRQYSISSAPGKPYYRISVKREGSATQDPDGLVSNHLHSNIKIHDIIEVSAPAGSFNLNHTSSSPAVFISGGVGQTPLISMLESLIESNSQRSKIWVHGCRDRNVHAFEKTIRNWKEADSNLESYLFYNTATEEEKLAGIAEGILDIHHLEDKIKIADAEYYLCGPAVFIEKNYKDLVNKGIKKEQIFYEEFGPSVLNLN